MLKETLFDNARMFSIYIEQGYARFPINALITFRLDHIYLIRQNINMFIDLHKVITLPYTC